MKLSKTSFIAPYEIVKSHCRARERIHKVSKVALKWGLDSEVCLGDLKILELSFVLSCVGSFSNRLRWADVACSYGRERQSYYKHAGRSWDEPAPFKWRLRGVHLDCGLMLLSGALVIMLLTDQRCRGGIKLH